MEEKDPIILLLNHMASELHTEVVLNADSTEFWKKAQSYIFENSIVSFREGVKDLSTGLQSDNDMFNYMSGLVFRTFAQPYTSQALKQFTNGFDEVASDPIMGTFDFKAIELSKIEQLLLFFVVHRDRITIAFYQHDEMLRGPVKKGKK